MLGLFLLRKHHYEHLFVTMAPPVLAALQRAIVTVFVKVSVKALAIYSTYKIKSVIIKNMCQCGL